MSSYIIYAYVVQHKVQLLCSWTFSGEKLFTMEQRKLLLRSYRSSLALTMHSTGIEEVKEEGRYSIIIQTVTAV